MRFPFSKFTIVGHSMLPEYKSGQVVLTFNWFYKPKVGDVVVAKWENKLIIKRVISINNSLITLNGDHKDSTSSKKLGKFQTRDIIGKVIF